MISYDSKGKTYPLLFVVNLHRNVNLGNNTCFPGFIFILFFYFNSYMKGRESCILIAISPVFLHAPNVFFWLCALFTSVNIKHEVCGVSVLLEVKVNIIPTMTTSYFLLLFQL